MTDNETKQKNKELCERYPFLIPWDRFNNDYEFTMLDEMPYGWRIAFGEQMCEEIRRTLTRSGGELALRMYRVLRIKEEFGGLRWCDYNGSADVDKIVDKYTKLSEVTCIRCGKPATQVSCEYISPFCSGCAKELSKDNYIEFTPLLGIDEER